MTEFSKYESEWVSEWVLLLHFDEPMYSWNIVESGVKHHKPRPNLYIVKPFQDLSFSYVVVFWRSMVLHQGKFCT